LNKKEVVKKRPNKSIKMKDFYVAQVRVFIEGEESVIVPISGQGYDPQIVQNSAESRVREHYRDKKITSMIISKIDYDLDEYKKVMGGTPPWLGGKQNDKY
jgi:hypothetical protein